MVSSKASTVAAYLEALPPDRRAEIERVRAVVLEHLPDGYEERMQYGMIGYAVPLSLYPPGFHVKKGEPLPFAALAAQKNYCSLYLLFLYGDSDAESEFIDAYARSGKVLDMGKSCIRFRHADDLALDVIGKAIAHMPVQTFINHYERTRSKH